MLYDIHLPLLEHSRPLHCPKPDPTLHVWTWNWKSPMPWGSLIRSSLKEHGNRSIRGKESQHGHPQANPIAERSGYSGGHAIVTLRMSISISQLYLGGMREQFCVPKMLKRCDLFAHPRNAAIFLRFFLRLFSDFLVILRNCSKITICTFRFENAAIFLQAQLFGTLRHLWFQRNIVVKLSLGCSSVHFADSFLVSS